MSMALNETTNSEPHSQYVDKHILEELQLYISAMSYEHMLCITYHVLLSTLEVGLFSLVLLFVQLGYPFLWQVVLLGEFLALLFGLESEYRARNVDAWRTEIVNLVKKNSYLKHSFIRGNYWTILSGIKLLRKWKLSMSPFYKSWKAQLGRRGHWFEEIVVPALYMFWLFLLFKYSNSLFLKFLSCLGLGLYILLIESEFLWELGDIWDEN